MPTLPDKNSQELHVLSQLTLNPATAEPAVTYVAGLSTQQRDALVSLPTRTTSSFAPFKWSLRCRAAIQN